MGIEPRRQLHTKAGGYISQRHTYALEAGNATQKTTRMLEHNDHTGDTYPSSQDPHNLDAIINTTERERPRTPRGSNNQHQNPHHH